MNKTLIMAFLLVLVLGGLSYSDITNPGILIKSPILKTASMIEVPQNARHYSISEGVVSYTALKKFFNKPEQNVVGTSSEVIGEGWFNQLDSSGYVKAIINIDSIKTDNNKRDIDVQKLFKDPVVTFEANIANLDLSGTDSFNLDVPGQLTMNAITQEVIFKVSGSISDHSLEAEGSTTVKMSDFGLNPPSLANVFTADDNLELKFDIKAQ